ncbi:DUF1311 domain-containing protein [Psychromarinibacter sp. C21-152]|uniref:DUF1311 domain-containing protein n=1 Tax=Psychromarinibacter sediminicola TaxID=3033385 RepID=A0AAE3T6G1_9RHOB|nr:lysozyme inhibitor LprI family protein [Psychromarinibacter sediminicola]MDF0599212.1 DUF1311 domain-containing protein [Psychromarinibacter sediminicola]
MKRLILSLPVLLAALPGQAQELEFDISHTERCLAAAEDRAAREACAGTSAQACMETPAGGSTVGMGGCLWNEYQWWDDRLNAVYRDLRASDRAEDAEYGDMPGAGRLVETLRDMQRAWIDFRDATCDYERAQWGGGTGGGPAATRCLMRMTAEQVFYLEARRDAGGGR